MKTYKTTLTIIFEYEEAEPENGIQGGWVLADITDHAGREVDLSTKTMDELTEILTK